MTAVRFAVESVRSDTHAAAPTLVFRVAAEEPSGGPIQAGCCDVRGVSTSGIAEDPLAWLRLGPEPL
jgi:hypothetical protein